MYQWMKLCTWWPFLTSFLYNIGFWSNSSGLPFHRYTRNWYRWSCDCHSKTYSIVYHWKWDFCTSILNKTCVIQKGTCKYICHTKPTCAYTNMKRTCAHNCHMKKGIHMLACHNREGLVHMIVKLSGTCTYDCQTKWDLYIWLSN